MSVFEGRVNPTRACAMSTSFFVTPSPVVYKLSKNLLPSEQLFYKGYEGGAIALHPRGGNAFYN